MELQAIRYAAMVSTMTFDGVVDVFAQYLNTLGQEDDAREILLEFLDWEEPDEDKFAQEVRIVLASAEFSKEITTSVLWLNEHGLDIRCIRLRPYRDGQKLLLDVQQVIHCLRQRSIRSGLGIRHDWNGLLGRNRGTSPNTT